MNIEDIKRKIRSKNNKDLKTNSNKVYFKRLINRVIFSVLITGTILIFCSFNNKYKEYIKKEVFTNSINLSVINNLYTTYFGDIIPFKDIKLFKEPVAPTFNSKIEYEELNIYKDGIKLSVDSSYLVPNLETGLVTYVGEKEGYNECAVVETIKNYNVWYCNLSINNVKLYDYIKQGDLIGEVNNELYLVYESNNKIVSYKDYFEEIKS